MILMHSSAFTHWLRVLERIHYQLDFELAEQNSTKIGHMFRSECHLKMNVRNLGYRLP